MQQSVKVCLEEYPDQISDVMETVYPLTLPLLLPRSSLLLRFGCRQFLVWSKAFFGYCSAQRKQDAGYL